MTTIVTRAGKGSALSYTEMDDNFTNLNNDKQEHSANLDEFSAINPTAAGLALLDDVDAAAQRTTLGLSSASQVEMETGTEANLRAMSPLRVAQAIAALAAGGSPVETQIHSAASKTTPVDADEFGLVDSAASFALKKTTLSNLKTVLMPYVAPSTSGNVLTSNGTVWTSAPPAGGASLGRLISTRYYPASAGTFTVTIASPGVFTKTAHGYPNGMMCRLTTTGALPTGLALATTYFVVNQAANTFNLSLTEGGAAINTSGTQSGTHTITPVYDKSINSPTFVEVEGVGGGGGGGGSSPGLYGFGGAGGGYFRKTLLASALGATETVTIGAGGTAGGMSPTSGGAGGTTSFGSHASATGGAGALLGGGTVLASPGTGTGGDLNLNGDAGGGIGGGSGHGGGSQFAGITRGLAEFGAGIAATSPGGGGSGANDANKGGAGFRGLVIVREYS